MSNTRPVRKYLSELQSLTLPLSEEGIMHHSKFVPKEYKLLFNQGFGQNIYNLLICGDILKLDHSLLNPISNEVIHDLNMLGSVMEYWILRAFDTTLITTIYHHRIQLLIKQSCKQFAKQNGFTTCHTRCHILCLC
jgi:hypothetical protein